MTRSVLRVLCLATLLSACGSETPRTQVTLMIDADPLLKSQLGTVTVAFASGPLGAARADLVTRPTQTFHAPFTWPLVVALVPAGENTRRAFEVVVTGATNRGMPLVEASARSNFVARKNLALRMRLYDACRSAVFAGCDPGQTCDAADGSAGCQDNTIDPSTLPAFTTVDPGLDGSVPDTGTDTGVDAGEDSQVPSLRDIGGRVFSTGGLLPLAGAVVSLPSGDTTTTGVDGTFTLSAATDDADLTIEHPEHAFVTKALPNAASIYLEIFVKQVDVRQDVATATGGEVKAANGTAVSFPASAFQQLNGAMATGMASVTLASPDTKDSAQAQAFPGDFKANAMDGKEGKLSALVALDVTATIGGSKLNLRNGTEAEITLPTKTVGTAQVVDLWSFDTTAREWKKEGSANLTRDSSGKSVYRAKIKHLSWWAIGTLIEDVTCARLCATFNGSPAAFARTTVSGVDESFQGSFYADASGCVAFDVPLSTEISVVTQSVDGDTPPRVHVTSATVASSDDPTSCEDLGTIALTARGTITACPSSRVQCGGSTCIDLTSDATHCGACDDAACQAGERCVSGACACGTNEMACDGLCTDTRRNPQHCGGCGQPCTPSQTCSQSRCVDVVCATPTTNCSGICVDLARDGVNGQCPGADPTADCVTDNDCVPPDVCELTTGMCVPDQTCVPTMCADTGANCGSIADGCGNILTCGTCPVAETCGGGGVPNVCGNPPAVCGDGVVSGTETCDDGDWIPDDGCSATCQIESGWLCPTPGSSCVMDSDPCDGLDNDSDTNVDEGFVSMACGITGGDCVAGTTVCMAGSVVCLGGVGPSAEVCDGRDNNCDGQIDEGLSGCTCQDSVLNGTETDVDCGGGYCPPCQANQSCILGSDCVTAMCNANLCAP